MSPQVLFHALAGVTGLVSGATALFSRKGSRVHIAAGRIFAITMVTTAGSGAILGALQGEIGNAVAGVLTIYMLFTGVMAVRRAENQSGLFEWGLFLFAASGAVLTGYTTYVEVQNGNAFLGGVPGTIFASLIGLAALGDLSVIVRRGIAGAQRIARHLWRMHLGFAAAVGSFFPGQIDFFPEAVQNVRPLIILFIPPFAVIGSMLVWLAIVLITWRARPAEAAA
ncbi:MAG: hypothetical protein AB7J28_07310 [Hyphomonadaceae bacterium]